MNDSSRREAMRVAALAFAKRDAAEKIATEIIHLAETHYNKQ